jgi:hypothetical protein
MPFSHNCVGPPSMPSLRDVQRAVARSILARDDIMATQDAARDLLVGTDRLGIYRNNFIATLTAALRLSYPVVERLVGAEFFEGAVRSFIDRYPPRTAFLNEYGAELADFLGGFPPAGGVPYLPDVARLEWAVTSSLNAVDAPVLDLTALESLDDADHDRVRFVPHPSLRQLSILYPADTIWRSVVGGDDAALSSIELTAEPKWLLVHRGPEPEEVMVRRLTPEEARLTAALCSGVPLAQALPKEEHATAIALLADHLASGRFSGFEPASRDEP